MHVRVEPYSPAWAAQFKAEAARVADALDGALIEIHHIGSTSVRGFAFFKPQFSPLDIFFLVS